MWKDRNFQRAVDVWQEARPQAQVRGNPAASPIERGPAPVVMRVTSGRISLTQQDVEPKSQAAELREEHEV